MTSDSSDNNLLSAVILEIQCDSASRIATVRESSDIADVPVRLRFNELQVMIKHGALPENLPFNLTLNDFI